MFCMDASLNYEVAFKGGTYCSVLSVMKIWQYDVPQTFCLYMVANQKNSCFKGRGIGANEACLGAEGAAK